MEVPNPELESQLEAPSLQEETYTGEASFLYSTKMNCGLDVASACETLAASDAFSFALDSHGCIYFKENGRLRSQKLNIETTITELGMTISGLDGFINSNPGITNTYALSHAINLLLSDKKLFNAAFSFPTESARVFMRPLAIQTEGNEDHELFIPYIRIYSGGIISLSLSMVLGFEDATLREITHNQVNKSRRNLTSLLCERELHLASTEYQISKMPLRERLAQKKALTATIDSALESPEELELLDERLTFFELVSVDQLTLSDIARNLLSLVGRAITLGTVRTRINWFSKQYRGDVTGEFWCGKPIIYIRSHSNQKESASHNWETHKNLVDSVMSRTYVTSSIQHAGINHNDMRIYDDYNNFYNEAVSLMLSSKQVESFIEQNSPYTFSNLTSDIQVLNEASHFIRVYYSYAAIELDKCKTATDVARLELRVMSFEESLFSVYKYSEVANYIDEVKRGELLSTVYKILHKKFETVRKGLELDEKMSSESATRRITIIFGIIASATLSPELMQPLAKYLRLSPPDESLSKLYGIGASVLVVITILTTFHYIPAIARRLLRLIRG